ncbi:MAG: hypothetical protein QM503_10580 [Bacteroidota bacterium]
MTIESKPLLILQKAAFTALIEKLQRNRKTMKLKTKADYIELQQLEETLSESEIMLDAIINELKNKHDYVDPH